MAFIRISAFLTVVASMTAVVTATPKIEKVKYCPKGTVEVGKQCEKVQTLPLIKFCPAGSELTSDDRCITRAPIAEKCSEGFTRNGPNCERVTEGPSTPTCPEGFTLDGDVCKKTVDRASYCPKGYLLRPSGICEREVAPIVSCPAGYTQSAYGRCLKTSPATPSCPEGTVIASDGESCNIPFTGPTSCPAGFAKNPSTNSCGKLVPSLLEPCPAGFSPSASLSSCSKAVATPATPYCKEGNLLSKDSVCTISVPQVPFCPTGYSASVAQPDICERFAKPIFGCPPGYKSSTDEAGELHCTREIPQTPEPLCPPGYELSPSADKCERTESIAPSQRCPKGSGAHEDGCAIRRSVDAHPVCPKGFQLSGHKCVLKYKVDCSFTEIRKECVQPPKKINVSVQLRGHNGVGYYPQQAAAHQPHQSKEPICTQQEVLVPKTCEKEEIAAPDYYCPDKTLAPHTGCVEFDSVPKEPFCAPGFTASISGPLTCTRVLEAPVSSQCPAGSVGKGSGCASTEEVPSLSVCPAGFKSVDSTCVKTAALVKPAPRVVTLPVSYRCQKGNLVGLTCVEEFSTPRGRVCPKNSSPIDERRCIEDRPVIPGKGSVYKIVPNFVCKDGQAPEERLCTEESHIKEYSCPSGSTERLEAHSGRSALKCIETVIPIVPPVDSVSVPPVYVCPAGSTLDVDNKCKTVAVEAHSKFCESEGYAIVGDVCAKYGPIDTTCAAGYTKAAGRCEAKSFQPHLVKVITTCHKGSKDCKNHVQ